MIGPAREGCQTSVGRAVAGLARAGGGLRRRSIGPCDDTPREYRRIALRRPSGRCYPLRALGAGDVRGSPPKPRSGSSGTSSNRCQRTAASETRADPWPRARPWPTLPINRPPITAGSHRRMDAKQVWRAALGELQVSLSPANFETWLRDTPAGRCRRAALPDRRPERLRQGLARVPLPLADQPDAGPDRRLQRPGRVRHRAAAGGRAATGRRRPTRAAAAGRRPAPSASRSGSSRPGSAARAARPSSTRATRSPTSSSARPTGSPTRPACPSPSAPATPTTRCSCTAGSASARPT